MVRAAGVEPAQLFRAEGFSYHYGFRRLAWARPRFQLVCGLDYTFTVARSRLRCSPSSLYTFAPVVRPERLARDCLLPVSPNLGSSTPSVSRRALNLLKSLASTNFATPAHRAFIARPDSTAKTNTAGFPVCFRPTWKWRPCRPIMAAGARRPVRRVVLVATP
jgi:hypothetical protein